MLAAERKHCRLCGSAQLNMSFDLGNMASCGLFPGMAETGDDPSAPLAIIRCRDCGLVQAAHDYEMSDLFGHTYGYRSGLNESMKAHLESLVADLLTRVSLGDGDYVLDIGSNDSTLLNSYRGTGVKRVAIDPVLEQFRSYYDDDILTAANFFNAATFRDLAGTVKAKAVTSISMFYDLPDPVAFARDIASILDEDGIWVFEQSYMPTMVERNSFDTICHEHLEYYCFKQIEKILADAGLQAIDVTFNDTNGGSFRVFAAHLASSHTPKSSLLNEVREREVAQGYGTDAPLEAFSSRIAKRKQELLSLLNELKAKGKLVHGYGASTKGNTLLQHYEITTDLVPAIADRNEIKWGSRTPGTRIPIISEEESRAAKPDYYLALPWHFRNGFLARERAFRENGGKFIFPLPEVEIV